jgi:DNA-binding XRE family transcriptional regulator
MATLFAWKNTQVQQNMTHRPWIRKLHFCSSWWMDISKAFGENVRKYRKARGLSQEQFALKYEVDRTYISGIERGKRNPTIEIVQKLARALGVSIADLFDGCD